MYIYYVNIYMYLSICLCIYIYICTGNAITVNQLYLLQGASPPCSDKNNANAINDALASLSQNTWDSTNKLTECETKQMKKLIEYKELLYQEVHKCCQIYSKYVSDLILNTALRFRTCNIVGAPHIWNVRVWDSSF